jgi:hypothetical protein
MSDQTSGDDGGNRATIALAVAKIDGLHQLTRSEFKEVKERIGKLEGLPERVARLEERVHNLEQDGDYRRGPGVANAISGIALLVAIAALAVMLFLP